MNSAKLIVDYNYLKEKTMEALSEGYLNTANSNLTKMIEIKEKLKEYGYYI
ncbi:hypothetical protein [Bacillus cereus]|uniref:hypothetical protein n=1 Tax=Bacillus cereus TaxID=1396 RepID=UPI001642E2A5|nr:hypothetical protein [Bacillus cereus]